MLAAATYSADSLGDIYEDTAHAATSYRADTRKLSNPCLAEPFSSMPFCNASLTIDQRAKDAVGRMSLEEKIDALGTKQGPTPSLGQSTTGGARRRQG